MRLQTRQTLVASELTFLLASASRKQLTIRQAGRQALLANIQQQTVVFYEMK